MARILLVEDDDGVVAVFTSILSEAGHQVDHVGRASDALSCVEGDGPYDIVLMDLSLDGEHSGTDAAVAIRAIHGNMPIIATTGGAVPQDKATWDRARFDAVLVKPILPGTLLSEIDRQLKLVCDRGA